jgi:acetyltransferase
MGTIQQVTGAQTHAMLEDLTQLLQDAVESGASVGFLPPLDAATARTYWVQTIDEVQHEARLLWVACQDSDIVGTVQLALAPQPNARHRAEVQKLMVHTRQRRQGLGQALMRAVEVAARPPSPSRLRPLSSTKS